MEKRNVIVELSFKLALKVIEYTERLEKDHKYVIAKQVLRSGTSVGANIHEAQSAESKADFIHKLKIADKGLKETFYWIKLCEASDSYHDPPESLLLLLSDVGNVLSKIIISTKRKQ